MQKIFINKDAERVSVIGSQWADPIADLTIAWNIRLKQANYSTHLTLRDAGTCNAIILLLAVMLESYTAKAAIEIREVVDDKVSKPFEAPAWWAKSVYCNKDQVIDVFAVRNVLAHNHLYTYTSIENAQNDIPFTHVNGGRADFHKRIENGKFVASGISSVTDSIVPNDVNIVSKIVRDTLKFLSGTYGSIPSASVDFTFAKRAQYRNLWELIEGTVNSANAIFENNQISTIQSDSNAKSSYDHHTCIRKNDS
jgi:hypothetical protein